MDEINNLDNIHACTLRPMVERILLNKIQNNQKQKINQRFFFTVDFEQIFNKLFQRFNISEYMVHCEQLDFLDKLAKAFTGMSLSYKKYEV